MPNMNGVKNLSMSREQLNRYVSQLHDPLEHYELTPFQSLESLRNSLNVSPLNFQIDGVSEWTPLTLEKKKALISDALKQIDGYEKIEDSVWYGVCRSMPIQVSDLSSFQAQLSAFLNLSKQVLDASDDMASSLGMTRKPEQTFRSIQQMAKVVSQLWSMPKLDKHAFANDVWSTNRGGIDQLIQ